MKRVNINEERLIRHLTQKIADYWNGKIINVTVPSGAYWSDFAYNAEGIRDRVAGTHDKVTAIVGEISAIPNGDSINFHITYNINIQNIG